jgi:hypothetical protein
MKRTKSKKNQRKHRKDGEPGEERQERRQKKPYAPPTLPNAVANKLWLVFSIHPHPKSDVQAFVPPMPMPPMLGSGHHLFLLEVEVEEDEGVPANHCVSGELRCEEGAGER